MMKPARLSPARYLQAGRGHQIPPSRSPTSTNRGFGMKPSFILMTALGLEPVLSPFHRVGP